MSEIPFWLIHVANDGPVSDGNAVKTPTASVPTELSSVKPTVQMKRSASCDAVTVDDRREPSTSHQLSATNQAATTTSDLRYVRDFLLACLLIVGLLVSIHYNSRNGRMQLCSGQ